MKLNEKPLENKFKYVLIQREFKEINDFVEVYLMEGSVEDRHLWMTLQQLDHNESYTFDIRIDKSLNIYKVLIEAINYTYWSNPFAEEYGSSKQIEAYAFYSFTNGEIHDLLAVIDTSGDILTITKMPEPKHITKVDFY